MKMLRFAFPLLVLCQFSSVLAQPDDEAAKERLRQQTMLVESIIAESRDLRLPENRAIVLARVGTRFWEIDQERARDLLTDAAAELVSAFLYVEEERRRNPSVYASMHPLQSSRGQILALIGARDAEIALRTLYRTRTTEVERGMSGQPPTDQRIRTIGNNEAFVVQSEINLERMLIRMSADQNPEKAAEILRTALRKGVGPDVLDLLRKLHEKDPESAASLGREAIGQLIHAGYMVGSQPDHNTFQTAFVILSDHIRQRPATDKTFRFSTADIKALFDKLSSVVLDLRTPMGFQYSRQMIPIAEKLRPDSVLRFRELERRATFAPFQPQNAETFRRLTSTDIPVEQAMAEAAKLDAETRRQVYQSVAHRLTAGGDVNRARQILHDNLADRALSAAREAIDQQYVNYLINQGKFADAEAFIDEFSDSIRFHSLISLADGAFSRDQKDNQSFSIRILQKARSSLPERPEIRNDMQQMMRLINAYIRIETSEAFNMMDTLSQQINELSEAWVIVQGFEGGQVVRRGEIVLHSSGNPNAVPGIEYTVYRGLAQKDFDRTMALIRAYSRRETRTLVALNLLEGYQQRR